MNSQIVVVEDEPLVAELLRDVLEPEGFSVVAIAHPNVAREIDPANPPDLILVDMMLPSEDGIKLAAHLRTQGLKHTPMIAMSASSIMLHFATLSELFQDCIEKPFDLSQLLDTVERHVGIYVV